jgi:type IV pilus assembly protein PilE
MTNRPACLRANCIRGFTLIELMIAVAVIAILATIAYPSYTQYVRQARRAEAQSEMLKIQLGLEKWRANNNSYATYSVSPASNGYYNFTVTGASASAYAINATAIAGKGQTDDVAGSTACSPLTLNQSGVKGPSGCWKGSTSS